MTIADIRGHLTTRLRSSRGAISRRTGMRTEAQELSDAVVEIEDRTRSDDFIHAIRNPPPGESRSLRRPLWYIARYASDRYQPMIDIIETKLGFEHKEFTYRFRPPRGKPVTRFWLPGYAFVKFDVDYDLWGQLLRVPGVLGLLGVGGPTPIEDEMIESLEKRLVEETPKNTDRSVIPVGTRVMITKGTFRGISGVVEDSVKTKAKIVTVLFNRPSDTWVDTCHLEILE